MPKVQSEDASYGSALVNIGEQNEVMRQKLNTLLSKQTQIEDKLKTEKVSGTKRKAAALQPFDMLKVGTMVPQCLPPLKF